RGGKLSLGRPFDGYEKKVHDYGDITRNHIDDVYSKFDSSKTPITIGGDHSITSQIVNVLGNRFGKISLVYFDAHPDFVSSTRNYYGSVITDVLSNINIESSMQIGIRSPEKEELDNVQKYNLQVITPFDIQEKGIKEIAKNVLEKLGTNVYISFDMDCIDPSFAPGVSVPVPMGVNSLDAAFLLREIAKRGIVGFDIMEVCPNFDVKDRTSHLASRLISEVIFSSGGN
ncbi:MAG: arginase family protein, partial [Nitrosopumilus sp.]|nr:arginase family protein [Nitrosopumilus sp.]